MIGRNSFLDLKDNLGSFLSALGFKVVPLSLGCFENDHLCLVSLALEHILHIPTYLKIGWMSPCDLASYNIAEMYCGGLSLAFEHSFTCRSWHNV